MEINTIISETQDVWTENEMLQTGKKGTVDINRYIGDSSSEIKQNYLIKLAYL